MLKLRQLFSSQYLDIYLKINEAENLQKQGEFRGAIDTFKDCYTKLVKIHKSDPNWENALVTHRMADCQAKIIELEPMAAAQAPTPPPEVGDTGASTNAAPNPAPSPAPSVSTADSDQVASLKLQLQAVKQELQITKDQLKNSQEQLETYRVQLKTVNDQLAALKNQQSVDDKMGKLLSDNKTLTDKTGRDAEGTRSLQVQPEEQTGDGAGAVEEHAGPTRRLAGSEQGVAGHHEQPEAAA